MTAPRLEVAEVLRRYGADFLAAFGNVASAQQRRVLHDLVRCRTAELGGHVEECDHCGYRQIAYNSCRNRHCPKCQAQARARWLDERNAELLPVEYFHVVFTLPSVIGPLALQNPRVVYGTLFHAAAETLLQIARDPKHLGADIGFLAVLHTWGQNLQLHPHVHCVVPGGGISRDGSHWVGCRPGFFLPVRVLSRLFRGKFLAFLQDSFERGQLAFYGQQQALADTSAFRGFLDRLRHVEWVVYAKRPFGGPQRVLKYLARYTHRVAISNHRLIKIEDDKVHFHWKDYADNNVTKVMALDAVEFIRRFLLHVVPSGFVRIRHYGFLANRHRQSKVEQCRRLLQAEPPTDSAPAPAADTTTTERESNFRCPACKQGRMVIVEQLRRPQRETGRGDNAAVIACCDTS